MENDETVEKDTPSEPSTEETNSENVTEDEKKSEPMIPKSRFDEVNTELKKVKEKLESLSPKKEESKKDVVTGDTIKWIEFTIENRDLDKEQLKVARRLYDSGVSLEKVLEDPLYEAFTEKHQKEKVENETTPSSTRLPKSPAEKPVSEMTDDEHKEYFKKLIGK